MINYMISLSLGIDNDEWLEMRVNQVTLNYLLYIDPQDIGHFDLP